MDTVIDARGLSCPQPVLLTLDNIKKQRQGKIEILIDTETSKENVGRAAASKGWQVKDVKEEGQGYRLTIIKD